jgi:hypothetical protein
VLEASGAEERSGGVCADASSVEGALMTLPPTKLAAARLAAAEIFIAEWLQGTNWTNPDGLRSLAEVAGFSVWYRLDEAAGAWVDVREREDGLRVSVTVRGFRDMAVHRAIEAATVVAKAAEIARKVEAAIAKVAGEGET